jgi:hypothetical protein
MGRSMYQYGNQTKEKERQRKQIAKHLKRSLAKQQAGRKEHTLPEGANIQERTENE